MDFNTLPLYTVSVDAGTALRPFRGAAQSVGLGGVNSDPIPTRVAAAVKALRPTRVRTFIQEYFNVLPEKGEPDFSRLDPYLEALASTGADIVAALTVKPPVLYGEPDPKRMMPEDPEAWQQLVKAMVTRYSVERPWVTYWELGNEPDIGEDGGCPYLAETAADFYGWYALTADAVADAAPGVRIGGPALAYALWKELPAFLSLCREHETRFDFLSWHTYTADPEGTRKLIRATRAMVKAAYGEEKPILITEYGPNFEKVPVAEQAFAGSRVVTNARNLLLTEEEGVETFYYHMWDQEFRRSEFLPFFSDPYIMQHHWNEIPHRFGFFGVDGEVRPGYFLYALFRTLGQEVVLSDTPEGLEAMAVRGSEGVSVMLVNGGPDCAANLNFANLTPGPARLTQYRLGDAPRWDEKSLTLKPVETRALDLWDRFECRVVCPENTVTVLRLARRG